MGPVRDFAGAKLALIDGPRLLAYRRDDRPDIPWPNYWDLPGGGRESRESPADCALRELYEEFGLLLPERRLVHARCYAAAGPGGLDAWFFAGAITALEIARIRFGSEGQGWVMMEIDAFLTRADAPPPLQERLRDALQALGPEAG
ncbi:MAG: NUDIX hydrolase [Oceanicaulis sp.]